MIQVDKIIELIVGLFFLWKGETAFGVTLIVFALTNITFRIKE